MSFIEQFEWFAALDPRHASSLSHVNSRGLVKRTGFSASHGSCAEQLAVLTAIRSWFFQRIGLVALDVILVPRTTNKNNIFVIDMSSKFPSELAGSDAPGLSAREVPLEP